MTRRGHYPHVVEHLAAALGRCPAWLAVLRARGIVTDAGGALPLSIPAQAGDWCVVWTGAIGAVAVALAGGGTGAVQTALDRDDGTSYILITGHDGVGSLSITGSAGTVAAYHASTPGAVAQRVLIDAVADGGVPAPAILVGQPDVQRDPHCRDGWAARAQVDVWLQVPRGDDTPGDDFLDAGELACRMLDELGQQGDIPDLLGWELMQDEVRGIVRGDPLSDREGVLTVPMALALEVNA